MHLIRGVDQIPNDMLKTLYLRWKDLAKDVNDLPFQDAIDSGLLEEVEDHCKYAHISYTPFRVYYNSVGKGIKDLYDSPIEGQYLDEIFDPWIQKTLIEAYETCAFQRIPVYDQKKFSTLFGDIGYEFMLLPFCPDTAEDVSRIVSCTFPINKNIKKYADWAEKVFVTPWLKK